MPLWTNSQRPFRKGWQLVCWTGLPIAALMCARNNGVSMWSASSRMLESFHAGLTLR